jgi:aspartate/methionine/tyrosine aminotransferase
VCGGSHDNLLAVYSLSKQSNLAGYRAAFVAGDPALIAAITEVRRHAGMMLPGPVQAAMVRRSATTSTWPTRNSAMGCGGRSCCQPW